MNIDIITKEILALCFMNANCLYSLSEEKLKLELFKGYEKYYLDLISHASKTRSPFNYEAYFVLNPNAMQLAIDSVSSSEDFSELLINFKAYHFRKSLKERTDKAMELLENGNHKDLTKAYSVLRQDIDLTNSTGVTRTLGELAETYDYTKPRNYIKVNYKALDGLNIENTDLVIIAGRPAMG